MAAVELLPTISARLWSLSFTSRWNMSTSSRIRQPQVRKRAMLVVVIPITTIFRRMERSRKEIMLLPHLRRLAVDHPYLEQLGADSQLGPLRRVQADLEAD